MRQVVALILMFALVVALVIGSLLLVATPAHGAGRPKPACVGAVIGYIDPGMEFVRRKDGSKCVRPSARPVKQPVKVTR